MHLCRKDTDDIVFFADEAGSWQVGVDWKKVLPAYFTNITELMGPDEYAAAVLKVIDGFVDYDRKQYVQEARRIANKQQKKSLCSLS